MASCLRVNCLPAFIQFVYFKACHPDDHADVYLVCSLRKREIYLVTIRNQFLSSQTFNLFSVNTSDDLRQTVGAGTSTVAQSQSETLKKPNKTKQNIVTLGANISYTVSFKGTIPIV